GSTAQVVTESSNQLGTATITAGTNVTVTPGANTITIATTGAVSNSFPTDSGTATPAAGALTIHGGTGINTSGSGSTVTVNLNIPVTVPDGGTGQTSLTAHSLLVGEGTSAITSLGAATNGQLPIGSTGADPVLATITAGTGITVTNGPGSITIAASGSGVVETITGNTGGSISPAAGNINIVTANATPVFAGSGSTETLDFAAPGNLALGSSLASVTTGTQNTALGVGALSSLTTGTNNSALGFKAGHALTTGFDNVAIGAFALDLATTGSYNVALGYNAGSNYIARESSNLLINNLGTLGESNVLRIGAGTGTGNQQLAAAYISGIDGVNVGSVAQVVTETGNQLDTATITAGTNVTVTPSANTITIATTGAVSDSFPTDSGTATPAAGALTIHGGTGINTSGSGSTVTVNLNIPVTVPDGGTGQTSLTAHSLLVGEGTSAITSLGAATNGQLPIGSTGADPVLATITAGTGITVTNGPGSITIAASGSGVVETITGNTGGAISPTAGNINIVTANATPVFAGSGSTETLDFAAPGNLALGSSLSSVQTATQNTALGVGALSSLTTGTNNSALGFNAGHALTSGFDNVALGAFALDLATTGSYNLALGYNAGANYIAGESSNILINNNGTLGESNVLRIGAGTGTGNQQLAKTFISGIDGVNVGSVAKVVTETGNQLGTATITAGTGVTVTPGANTITIVNSSPASGMTINVNR